LTLFIRTKSIQVRDSRFLGGANRMNAQLIEGQERAALGLWLDVTAQAVRSKGPDLTARQTALLLTVYLEQGPHTVRALAKKLTVGKPAIVRALDSLGEAGFLTRVPDPSDRRNVFIVGTEEGALKLGDYARNIANSIAQITRDDRLALGEELDETKKRFA
jgi:DNA-binding MarR family transcriptional regulator